ncbi:GTP cyclohydrolase [Snodgrassella sp. ESL0304]|uniref:YciI family protein n=1 Tax=Snodgrassella sp. ESL0304 TaxID=2705032 RepID=UPI001581D797|nr:YciI family protein [Snodgrassella sp. ESL0304]NUE80806.1 GTP cyclohydrolase [Snodgrassella sp. ESL0304]
MIIVTFKFKKPLEELLAKFEEHNKFLDEYFAKNKFIASGPLDNKTGAIIIVMSDSIEEVKNIMKSDPFCVYDLVDLEFTLFQAAKIPPNLLSN